MTVKRLATRCISFVLHNTTLPQRVVQRRLVPWVKRVRRAGMLSVHASLEDLQYPLWATAVRHAPSMRDATEASTNGGHASAAVSSASPFLSVIQTAIHNPLFLSTTSSRYSQLYQCFQHPVFSVRFYSLLVCSSHALFFRRTLNLELVWELNSTVVCYSLFRINPIIWASYSSLSKFSYMRLRPRWRLVYWLANGWP